MKFLYKFIILLAILVLVVVIPLLWVFRSELLHLLHTLRLQAEALGKIHPIFLIGALAILPALGFPAAIFFVIGSIAYGIVWGLVFSAIGVAINISLCYWIANSFLRKWILHILHRRGHKLITIPPSEARATIIAVRLMPGVPLFAQNYILGVAGVNFIQYFVFSLLIEILWAVFYILAANTAVHHSTKSLILAILGLLSLALFFKVFRHMAAKKKS